MRSRAAVTLIAPLLAACGVLSLDPVTSSRPASSPPAGATTEARVVAIVDGDTIRVEVAGEVLRLRYIGINAPERGTPFADEATEANRRLVAGARVRLQRDVSDTDRFGRLLRYVWVERDGSWLMVNAELVRMGLAVARRYPPDTGYHALLEEAQRQAREEGLGIWGQDAGRPAAEPDGALAVLPSLVRIPAGVAERQTQPA